MTDSRKDSTTRLRDHYNTEISKCVDGLVESFQNIVAAAGEQAQPRRENFQIEVFTANLVQHAEGLLKLVAELKQNIVLNDFPTMRKDAEEYEAACKSVRLETQQKLDHLQEDVEQCLERLENIMQSSTRVSASPQL